MIISNILLALAGAIASLFYMKNLKSACLSFASPEGFSLGRYIFNRILRLAAFCLIIFLITKIQGLCVLSFLAGFLMTNMFYTYAASRTAPQNFKGDRV